MISRRTRDRIEYATSPARGDHPHPGGFFALTAKGSDLRNPKTGSGLPGTLLTWPADFSKLTAHGLWEELSQ